MNVRRDCKWNWDLSCTDACLEYYGSQLVLGLGLALRPRTLPLEAALLGAQLQF